MIQKDEQVWFGQRRVEGVQHVVARSFLSYSRLYAWLIQKEHWMIGRARPLDVCSGDAIELQVAVVRVGLFVSWRTVVCRSPAFVSTLQYFHDSAVLRRVRRTCAEVA